MNVQPSCCLDVVVYMLNCVFWRHILVEIEFKSRVDMGSVAIGILHSGIAHKRLPNFRHGKEKKRKQKNRARRIYNSATPYGQAE